MWNSSSDLLLVWYWKSLVVCLQQNTITYNWVQVTRSYLDDLIIDAYFSITLCCAVRSDTFHKYARELVLRRFSNITSDCYTEALRILHQLRGEYFHFRQICILPILTIDQQSPISLIFGLMHYLVPWIRWSAYWGGADIGQQNKAEIQQPACITWQNVLSEQDSAGAQKPLKILHVVYGGLHTQLMPPGYFHKFCTL